MGKKYDIITTGVAILDSIITGFDPEPVSPAGFRAESCMLSAGGDAVNEAIAASKLGLKTAILCHLGNDAAGNIIASALEANGVSTELIIRSDEHPTPITTIFVKADGNRQSITNQAHNYNFHPELYADVFGDTRAVIIGSLFRSPFNDPDVIRQVAAAARSHGALVIADTKMPNFRKLTLEDISDSLPLIDYITPNEAEAEYYTGKKDVRQMADVFAGYGVQNVIIKQGEQGCYLRTAKRSGDGGSSEHGNAASVPYTSLSVPAFDLGAIDATGAGDNFIAGFTSEILRGSDPAYALKFANACGAICTTQVGAGTALKNRGQVLEVLEHNNES